MSLVRLPVNSRLLAVKFWGLQSYTQIYDSEEVCTPNPVMFKGQLHVTAILIFHLYFAD